MVNFHIAAKPLYLLVALSAPVSCLFEIGFLDSLWGTGSSPTLKHYGNPYDCNNIPQPPNPSNFIKWIVMKVTDTVQYPFSNNRPMPPQPVIFYGSQAPTASGPHCTLQNMEIIAWYYPDFNRLQWFTNKGNRLTHFKELHDNSPEWAIIEDEGITMSDVLFKAAEGNEWIYAPSMIDSGDDDFMFDGNSDENYDLEGFQQGIYSSDEGSAEYEYRQGSNGSPSERDTARNSRSLGYWDRDSASQDRVDPWDWDVSPSMVIEEEIEVAPDVVQRGSVGLAIQEDTQPAPIDESDRLNVEIRNNLVNSGRYIPVATTYRMKPLKELRRMGFIIDPWQEIDGIRMEWAAQVFDEWKSEAGISKHATTPQLTPEQRQAFVEYLKLQPGPAWMAAPYIGELRWEAAYGRKEDSAPQGPTTAITEEPQLEQYNVDEETKIDDEMIEDGQT
ncbi:hypothetical protein H072_4983 [Dactylellina haptotyla CBS 200.50]|uniref:Enterotoxin n=1 Tax=Dactylellina haptotyla (strain CBS 200.50) TaxID=1284197 RepID=S8ADT2_DACHA|nr:hypothetical protein H072_4983 [Dactylellina haptotyla CBS 200.50]